MDWMSRSEKGYLYPSRLCGSGRTLRQRSSVIHAQSLVLTHRSYLAYVMRRSVFAGFPECQTKYARHPQHPLQLAAPDPLTFLAYHSVWNIRSVSL